MACEEIIVADLPSNSFTREDVLRLMNEKDRIEAAIKDLGDILKHNNIDMNEPLVDMEDYPRSDIDVYQVRHARHRIRCLQNDHKDILRKIEEGLVHIHKEARLASHDPNGSNASSYDHLTPIVKVDQIHVASPASIDGLKLNDLVYKFGLVTSDNFVHIKDIGKIVQDAAEGNKELEVVVRRDNSFHKIWLRPRAWHGMGSLGCHIIPVVPSDLPDR